MSGDFDSLMAGMGVKRMKGDKGQAEPTQQPKPRVTSYRRRAKADPTAESVPSPERTPELERAVAHLQAKREEAESQLKKSKKRNTKLKRELAEVQAELAEAQQTVADVLADWGFDTPQKRAALLIQDGLLERIISTPALWTAEGLRAELTDRTIQACSGCEAPDDRRVLPVESDDCEICGGIDLATAARHVVDAALINGRLRILIVGRDTTHHRQVRAHLADKRLVLTQLPGTVRRDRASARTDVEHSDAIVIWDPGSVEAPLLEIYLGAGRVGEVEAGPLGVFFNEAARIIGSD